MANRRVLLVGGDLDRQVDAVYSEYLRRGHGYEVESIAYCDDALTALSQQRFDVMVLLSIFARWRTRPSRTVRFSGLELLKQMRALGIKVPVLVASASLLVEAKRAAFASGAFAFIGKLLNLADLDEALKKASVSGQAAPREEA